jgi:hypothetical protein
MRYTKKLSIVLLSVLVTAAGFSIPEAGAGGYGLRLHFGHGYHGKSYYGRQHYYPRQQYYGRNYRGYKSQGSYYRHNYHHSDPYRNQDYHRKHTLDGAYDNSSAGKYGDRLDYGWSLLEKGRPVEAQKVFAALASAHSLRGAPKIGYAVATTDMGQLSNFLGGEPNIAREKIHQSLKYGDSTASTKNLRRIIEDREVRHSSVDNEYDSSGDY